jgi:L-fucose isomerase-like protein
VIRRPSATTSTNDTSTRADTHWTYRVVASSLHDARAVDELIADVRSLLETLGGIAAADEEGPCGHRDRAPYVPLVYVVATGGTERQLLDDVARRAPGPVVLVAHGAHNSLPAALEALAAIQRAGGRGRIVMVTGDGTTDRQELADAVADLVAVAELRSTRLGLVGGPSSWLVASSPSPDTVRRVWGPEVVDVEPTRMIELTRVPVTPTGPLADRLTNGAVRRSVVPADDVHAAAAVRPALDDLLDADGLDAVSVRCFDLLGDPGTSGCLALASLNDDGIVAGCEGDVPSTLAMLWVRALLGRPSWMANPARIDVAAGRLVLAHCTVAPSMVDGFELDTHFESGAGVGISGRFAPQPVTLVRIGGTELDRCWIAEGRVVESGDDPSLCRTQATVEMDPADLRVVVERPLGNHLVLVAGHHGARLRRWWDLTVAPTGSPSP